MSTTCLVFILQISLSDLGLGEGLLPMVLTVTAFVADHSPPIADWVWGNM